MKLIEKRSFKAINFDDADEFLEDGDVRSMLNVRVGYTENGSDGIITNMLGTTSVFSDLGFTLPAGTNKCVGTCTDDQNNRLIWLNYNSLSNHGAYCYNVGSNTIETILVTSAFNFSGEIVHSIDILNNNLAWVDENRPRAINVATALAGTLGTVTSDKLINDAKVVPKFPPVCTSTVTFNPDFIESLKSFQFIYHYVFIGGEKSAWSTVSKLVPTAYRDQHIEKITLDVSACELFTNTELRRIISHVEFASREFYTSNFNQFLRISVTDLVNAAGLIEYDDTESKTPVDLAETNIAFYENPIKAGTVCFQNDRKFYADVTEGYDAFVLSPSLSGVNVQVIPASGGIPYLSDCSTHVAERYLKPDSEYGYSAAFYDDYGRKSGAIDLPQLSIKTQEQLSNDYKANVLQFTLNLAAAGSFPDWATKYEILRSDNKSVTYFVQGRVNRVFYCTGYDSNDDPVYIVTNPNATNQNTSDTAAIEIHIDISNWTQFGTNIGYSFTEGDRVTFFTMGGVLDSSATQTLKGLKIKELRGSLLIVDYPNIGRTNLNHAMLASTEYFQLVPPFIIGTGILSRFIVGDNGVALYSRFTQQISSQNPPSAPVTTPLAFPFPYTGIASLQSFTNFPTVPNNLYAVSLIYTGTLNVASVDIFIVGSEGYFIRGNLDPTTDTFGSWNTANSGVTTDLNCVESNFAYHTNTDLVIVGDNGVILNYNISTGVFTPRVSGTTENLNYVYRNQTSSTLIAVGDNGTILRSTNGGTSWSQIVIDNCQNLNGVYINGVYACAVGDEGLVLNSQDTGATWTQIGISTATNLNSVEGQGNSSNSVYIAGDDGYLSQFSMSSPGLVGGFSTGTTKNINFFQSYFVPATPDKGILVGDLDLLMDVNLNVAPAVFTSYSSNITSIYGAIYLNHRAKIEVYSPKTSSGPVIYYETGDAYAVGQNRTFNKGLEGDGDVFLIKKDFRGTDWTMTGDLVFSMTPNSLDTGGSWDKDLGRPNTVLLYPEKQERRNIIRYSEKYVQDSKINGLSNFLTANYEPVPNEYGWVRKITPLEYVLLINAERECATAYIDQTVFRGTDGQDVAATSDRVINNLRKLTGGFGCTNPESVVSYLGYCYWISSNKGASCRYNNSNGVFPISEYKARTYFQSMNPKIIGGTVIGGYEPKFRNFLLTFYTLLSSNLVTNGDFLTADGWSINPNGWTLGGGIAAHTGASSGSITRSMSMTAGNTYRIKFRVTRYTDLSVGDNTYVFIGANISSQRVIITGVGEYEQDVLLTSQGGSIIGVVSSDTVTIDMLSGQEILSTEAETIAFQEGTNRWISKYSFVPERYGYASMEMFSFVNGELWKHNANTIRNKFHGRQYPSQVQPVFNKPGQKNFTYLALEGGKLWSAPSITTEEDQETFILSGHFEKIQNEWFADIKQDINTPNMASTDEALINGDFMQSETLKVLLENTASDGSNLKFATVHSNLISTKNLQ